MLDVTAGRAICFANYRLILSCSPYRLMLAYRFFPSAMALIRVPNSPSMKTTPTTGTALASHVRQIQRVVEQAKPTSHARAR